MNEIDMLLSERLDYVESELIRRGWERITKLALHGEEVEAMKAMLVGLPSHDA